MIETRMDSDLLHTGANGSHRLPIIRLKPLLNATQLKSSNPARVVRKLLKFATGRSEPNQRLVHTAQYAGISITCQIGLRTNSRGRSPAAGRTIPPNVLVREDKVIR